MSYFAFAYTFDSVLYMRLEQVCGRAFDDDRRHDIRRFSLDAFEALGGGWISDPPYAEVRNRLERLSKSIARVSINLTNAISNDHAGDTVSGLLYGRFEIRLPDGKDLSRFAAVKHLTSVLGAARTAVDASLAEVDDRQSAPRSSKFRPLWP